MINDYLGGVLPEAQAQAVRAHLAECQACAKLETELSGTIALVQGLPHEQTSAGFIDGLRAKIQIARALQTRPVRPTSLWDRLFPARVARPLAVAAMTALIVVLSISPFPGMHGVDLAQTGFAEFCADQHAEFSSSPPIENQATEWLDAAPVSWSNDIDSRGSNRSDAKEAKS